MRTTLLSLLLLTSLVGQGQDTAVVDLPARGVNFLNGSMNVSQVYTLAKAKEELPFLFGWGKYKGMTDAEIMSFAFGEAVWHDGFWEGQKGDYSSATPSPAWNIKVGAGKYRVTGSLPFAAGIYEGQGSRFSDQSGTHTYGSTELYIDHLGWKDKWWPDRHMMKSANWGSDDSNGGWMHHTVIQHFFFNGMRRTPWLVNDGKEGSGVAMWDPGETSLVYHCYFNDMEKDCILSARSTPFTAEQCSFFKYNRFGVACMGSGNFGVLRCSGDEPGVAMVGGGPGYGRAGNAQITIVAFKMETGTSGGFRPWKGRPLVYFEGWATVLIQGGTYAATNITPYAFIHVWKGNGSLGGHTSSVQWSGVQFFGNAPKCILYDQTTNTEYGFVGNAYTTPLESGHWSSGYGMKNDWVTIPTSTGKGGSLQHVGPDGATSWATAGLYDPTGGTTAPPPPNPTPCTWTKTGTGACVNGRSLDTYSSSPTGCTGTAPVTYTNCTVTPPPPTSTIAHYTFNSGTTARITATVGADMVQGSSGLRFSSMTGGKVNNSRGGATYPVDWRGVTQITFTGLSWSTTTAPNYHLLLGVKDTDGQGRGIMVLPNGAVIDNRVSQGDRTLLPAGTVKQGQPVTFTVNLAAPMDVTFFGAYTGGCWVGSLDELKLQ